MIHVGFFDLRGPPMPRCQPTRSLLDHFSVLKDPREPWCVLYPLEEVLLLVLCATLSVSEVARRNGVAPNLLFRWRRLMSEGGVAAVGSDEEVVGASEVRRLEERVRELERLLGKKTMEVEILRDALDKANSKKTVKECT